MNDILWRRLRYMLSPQWDLYRGLAGKVENESVLEVGFGTGFGTIQLACRAESVTALDIDPEAQAFAEMCFPLPNVTWLNGDITAVNWTALIYDTAIMIEVLEHITDYGLALRNVTHCLKPAGRLFVSARNANADLRRNDLHVREWTARELKDNLLVHFEEVILWDYTGKIPVADNTRTTPLIAEARMPRNATGERAARAGGAAWVKD